MDFLIENLFLYPYLLDDLLENRFSNLKKMFSLLFTIDVPET